MNQRLPLIFCLMQLSLSASQSSQLTAQAAYSTSSGKQEQLMNASQNTLPSDLRGNIPLLRDLERLSKYVTKNPHTLHGRFMDDGSTLFMAATCRGSTKVVRMLVDKKADVNATDDLNEVALQLLLERKDREGKSILTFLLSLPQINLHHKSGLLNDSLLHCAVNRCNLFYIQQLVKKNVAINEPDNYGRTPLFRILYNSPQLEQEKVVQEIIGCLIAYGANPFIKDIHGTTVLDNVQHGDYKKLIPFIEQGTQQFKINILVRVLGRKRTLATAAERHILSFLNPYVTSVLVSKTVLVEDDEQSRPQSEYCSNFSQRPLGYEQNTRKRKALDDENNTLAGHVDKKARHNDIL